MGGRSSLESMCYGGEGGIRTLLYDYWGISSATVDPLGLDVLTEARRASDRGAVRPRAVGVGSPYSVLRLKRATD